MGAGLLQLSLSGNTFDSFGPKRSTYFQAEPATRSNYAIETKECMFDKQPQFGSRVSCAIPRSGGDLLGPVTLKVRMTKANTQFPFVNKGTFYPLENLCARATVTVGADMYDTHTSDWFRIYDNLHRTPEESLQYQRIANFDGATIVSTNKYTETLYLPLIFAFCRSPVWYLPLISIPHQEVRMTFDFRSAGEVGVLPDNFDASLLVDYVFLSEEERVHYISRDLTYRYECVQTTGVLVDPPSISDTVSVKVPIGFTGDIKSLYFVVKNQDIPFAPVSTLQPDGTHKTDTPVAHGRYFGDANGTYLCLQGSQFSPNGLCLLQAISEKLAPVLSARILFDGVDRVTCMTSHFFDKLQPFKHTARCPMPGIYMYSFVLDPTGIAPSGTALFDQLSVELHITFKKSVDTFIYNEQFDGLNAETCASNIQNCRDVQVFGLGFKNLEINSGTGFATILTHSRPKVAYELSIPSSMYAAAPNGQYAPPAPVGRYAPPMPAGRIRPQDDIVGKPALSSVEYPVGRYGPSGRSDAYMQPQAKDQHASVQHHNSSSDRDTEFDQALVAQKIEYGRYNQDPFESRLAQQLAPYEYDAHPTTAVNRTSSTQFSERDNDVSQGRTATQGRYFSQGRQSEPAIQSWYTPPTSVDPGHFTVTSEFQRPLNQSPPIGQNPFLSSSERCSDGSTATWGFMS